jgi:hypothetical protein
VIASFVDNGWIVEHDTIKQSGMNLVMFRNSKQFLLYYWYPSCTSCLKPCDKSWMKKAPDCYYDERNISRFSLNIHCFEQHWLDLLLDESETLKLCYYSQLKTSRTLNKVTMQKIAINLTCINGTPVYSEHKSWSKGG